MPIDKLSDKRRLTRLGKIRLGEKAITAKGAECPRALDHFGCPEEVQAIFGPRPTELEMMFPMEEDGKFAETLEIIFPQYLKRYGKSTGLVCKGDGKKAHYANPENEGGTFDVIDCDPEECAAYQNKQCRRVASLQFMLPKVAGFGVWQIDTTSKHSIISLNSSIEMIWRLCGKRIAGIPLILSLEPRDTQVNGKRHTIRVLTLKTSFSLVELQHVAADGAVPMLEAPLVSDEQPKDLYAGATPREGEAVEQPEPKPEKPEAPARKGTLDCLSEIEVKQLRRKAERSGTDFDSWLVLAGLDCKPDAIPREKTAEIYRRLDALVESQGV